MYNASWLLVGYVFEASKDKAGRSGSYLACLFVLEPLGRIELPHRD